MKTKILAGITEEGELYILEIDRESKEHPYFAMSGSTSMPILKERAEDQVREGLEEGEEWKYAVESGNTEMSKADWIDYVLSVDGSLAGFDNSLFPLEVEYEGEEYIFESRSCGQHEEDALAHYFIPEEQYRALMSVWKQYHLKPEPSIASMANGVIERALETASKQDERALAIEAVRLMEETD